LSEITVNTAVVARKLPSASHFQYTLTQPAFARFGCLCHFMM